MATPDGGGTDWIDRLRELGSISTDSLSQSVTKLVLLPIAAFFMSLAAAIEAGANVVILPLQSFGVGVANFVDSLLGGAGDIIGSGAASSAAGTDVFGIFAFPVGIAVTLAGAYIFAAYLSEEDTADLLPFTNTDLPFLGNEEGEE